MFRLTREVRFALTDDDDPQLISGRPTNSFGGFPSVRAVAPYLTLDVTLEGELHPQTRYLRNIKDVDDVVRRRVIQRVGRIVNDLPQAFARIPQTLLHELRGVWDDDYVRLFAVRLALSPYLTVSCSDKEHPMVLLSQRFEFCAAHRLHNPALSDDENRRIFGKCNNPNGHGHNYQLQVTLRGVPDRNGVLIDVPAMERIVTAAVVERFDHKNLNTEVAEFRDAKVIPSVENIAQVIYRILEPQFAEAHAHASLASVTVWETSKTWCEYSED
jgi:6-pyruvoyltetrahydropterin/6-carboxytetrahydropterin synthase